MLWKGGGLLPIMAYMGRWEQGTFSGFRYIKGNLQVERYEREGSLTFKYVKGTLIKMFGKTHLMVLWGYHFNL